MPLYEYQCKQCAHRLEKIESFSAPLQRKCPVCGGVMERLISAPAIRFKGSGFYETDYVHRSTAGDGNGPPVKESAQKESKETSSSPSDKAPAKSPSGESATTKASAPAASTAPAATPAPTPAAASTSR